MIREKNKYAQPVIDLTGPDGNAFSLLAKARKFGKQLSMSNEKIDALIERMMDGDYENLLDEFEKVFGDYVILER